MFLSILKVAAMSHFMILFQPFLPNNLSIILYLLSIMPLSPSNGSTKEVTHLLKAKLRWIFLLIRKIYTHMLIIMAIKIMGTRATCKIKELHIWHSSPIRTYISQTQHMCLTNNLLRTNKTSNNINSSNKMKILNIPVDLISK